MELTKEEARLVALGYLEDRILMFPNGYSITREAVSLLEKGDSSKAIQVFQELEKYWISNTGEIYDRRRQFVRMIIQALSS